MSRPCTCNRVRKGEPFDPARDCPSCWHWHNHEGYRRHHGGYPVVTLPCVHLGDYTGETVPCPTCHGSVRVKLRGCALHGTCTEQKAVPGCACCQSCPDRQPIAPVADVAIAGLPGHCFNGSIAEWNGKTWLCYRQNWSEARLAIVELGDDWQPLGQPVQLRLGKLAEDRWAQEDPRLFVFGSQLHVAYSGCQWIHGQIVVSVCVARLGSDLQAENCWYPSYPSRNEWEKNWGFFEHAEVLHAVHSIQGHRVLEIGHRAEDAHAWVKTLPAQHYGEPRGGACPVLVGDEYYSFFHGRTGKGLYTIGLYTFDAMPPFHPKRFSRIPLLYPDPTRKPGPGAADVVFPGGAILRGDRWHVSYGSYDQEIRVASWQAEHLERLLTPVE